MAGYNEKGELTTDIEWDTYEDECVCLNPHRENQTDMYCWVI